MKQILVRQNAKNRGSLHSLEGVLVVELRSHPIQSFKEIYPFRSVRFKTDLLRRKKYLTLIKANALLNPSADVLTQFIIIVRLQEMSGVFPVSVEQEIAALLAVKQET